MRITLVISSLERGGAERIMSLLASAWAQAGKDVTLLTLDSSEIAYPLHPAVKIHNLRPPARKAGRWIQALSRKILRVPSLRKAIRESCPDLVISFMDRPNILTLIATRFLKVPVIISERTNPSVHKIGPVLSGLRALLYPLAQATVCQTSAAAAWFQSKMRIKTSLIPNPLVQPLKATHDVATAREDGPHILLAVGRLHAYKGFDLLLRAFALVFEKHPQWVLRIVGDGPQRLELQRMATALGLAERVQFIGSVNDPGSEFREADLFVLSSRFEGFPNALCEAMAAGLPVVSFDCPWGPSEIIHNGLDGILVPPADVNALGAVLSRLMADPAERARLAERAPEIMARLDLSKILLLWEALFRELAPLCSP
jgi:glycosyltransferase involved in cell wall biosynthesis